MALEAQKSERQMKENAAKFGMIHVVSHDKTKN